MQVGLHIIVQGVVQGVGFRYFVHRYATNLGLTGRVQNLYNGDVEVEVEGERSLLESFIVEVKIGTRSAHVKDLKLEWQAFENKYRSFEIR